MASKFKVGDKVYARSFTDCFGKFHDTVTDLTVSAVHLQTFKPDYGYSHYRITTTYPNGFTAIEAAERFFELT